MLPYVCYVGEDWKFLSLEELVSVGDRWVFFFRAGEKRPLVFEWPAAPNHLRKESFS